MSDIFLAQADRDHGQISGIFNTLRFWGLHLVVEIVYANSWHHPSQLRYQYVPRIVPGLNHLDTEIKYSDDGLTRFKYKRYGINISFKFKGVLEKYSFIVMMQTLIAGLALLVVARTLMKLLALYIFADRQIYKAHIVHTTEDMEVYRKHKGLGPEARAEVRAYAGQVNRVGTGVLFDWYIQRDRYDRIAEAHSQALESGGPRGTSGLLVRDVDEASYASLTDSDTAILSSTSAPRPKSTSPIEWVNPAFAEPEPESRPVHVSNPPLSSGIADLEKGMHKSPKAQTEDTARPPPPRRALPPAQDEEYLARKRSANPYNQRTLELHGAETETYSI